jgi:hypothetical protein
MLNDTDILWAARSTNVKTGDVPTAWVGATRAACLESCRGCSLAPRAVGGNGSCYSHSGTPALAHGAIVRATAAGKVTTLTAAIRGAVRSARMLRYTAIGDGGRTAPGVADRIVDAARAAKLQLVGYTHHWRESSVAAEWRGRLMASVDTIADADAALSAGWRAAAVVPDGAPARGTTPGGAAYVVCPAQVTDGRVTCNDCRLCDASKPGSVIAFWEHGTGVKIRDARARAAAV